MQTRALLAAVLFFAALAAASPAWAEAPPALADFRDPENGFSFRYPREWEARRPGPETPGSEVRVIVSAPGGGLLTAIVGTFEEPVTKAALPPSPLRGVLVKRLVTLTVERLYGEIARRVKAQRMEVAETREVPCEEGIMCRILVIYHLPDGNPLAVSAVHAVAYGTNRLVNVIATVTIEEEAAEENALFDDILESFRLTGANRPAEARERQK